jgi:phosphotransferase system enzyme I (PtsP)
MGWRAIRLAIERPSLLRLQVRALLTAGAGERLRILFPMIADVQEFLAAKAVVEEETRYLARRGHKLPESVALGAMIEVPALLWQLDNLMPVVDFASIGSNDLVQFLFAADRGNARLSGKYDPLSPPVLLAMQRVADKGKQFGKPVTLCGELGGRALEAMALAGIGLTSLSMVPAAIGPVKQMLLGLDLGKLQAFTEGLLRSPASSVREELKQFADSHGIAV